MKQFWSSADFPVSTIINGTFNEDISKLVTISIRQTGQELQSHNHYSATE